MLLALLKKVHVGRSNPWLARTLHSEVYSRELPRRLIYVLPSCLDLIVTLSIPSFANAIKQSDISLIPSFAFHVWFKFQQTKVKINFFIWFLQQNNFENVRCSENINYNRILATFLIRITIGYLSHAVLQCDSPVSWFFINRQIIPKKAAYISAEIEAFMGISNSSLFYHFFI